MTGLTFAIGKSSHVLDKKGTVLIFEALSWALENEGWSEGEAAELKAVVSILDKILDAMPEDEPKKGVH